MKKDEEAQIKFNSLCTKITYIISILLLLIVGFGLSFIPNQLDTEYIIQHYIKDISEFCAEKSEMITYIVLTILFPIIFIVTNKLLQTLLIKKKNKINIEKISRFCSIFITIFLCCLTYIVFIKQKNYLNGTVLKRQPIVILVSVIPILVLIWLSEKYNNVLLNKIIKYVCLCTGFVVAYLYINKNYSLNMYMIHHVDAYYYPIMKIINGLTPGIDFNSIYGYYSYFYAIIISSIGKGNIIYTFSIVNSILVFFVFLGLLYVANKLIKNKIILFLSYFTIVYVLVIQSIIGEQSYYLQYMPHRVIFPVLILVYIAIYKKHQSKTSYAIGGYIIGSLALFWNFETGLVVLLLWILVLLYEIIYFNSLKRKETWIKILKILIGALISVIGYVILLNVITVIRTGKLIKISGVLSSQTLFAGLGFYMLPMPLLHPWLLFVLLYAGVLGIAISKTKIFIDNPNEESFYIYKILFALAILGIGIFSYYEGRSYWTNLFYVTYPGILLVGFLIDKLLRKLKKGRVYHLILCFHGIVILIIVTVTTVYTCITDKRVTQFFNKEELNQSNCIDNEIQEMKQIQETIPNVQLIIPNESYYYINLNLIDNKRFPAYVDLFTYEDIEKICNSIMENKNSWYILGDLYEILINKHSEKMKQAEEQYYKKYKKDENILLVQKSELNGINNIGNINEIEEFE